MSEKEEKQIVKDCQLNNTELSIEEAVLLYVESLDSIESEILKLAEKQLETSFSIEKSIGFLSYLKNKNIKIISE